MITCGRSARGACITGTTQVSNGIRLQLGQMISISPSPATTLSRSPISVSHNGQEFAIAAISSSSTGGTCSNGTSWECE